MPDDGSNRTLLFAMSGEDDGGRRAQRQAESHHMVLLSPSVKIGHAVSTSLERIVGCIHGP